MKPAPNRLILRDAAEVRVQVWGEEDGVFHVLSPSEVKPEGGAPTHFRLTEVLHSIESGVRIRLYWEGVDEHTLIMPIEGRGNLQLDRLGGLPDPKVEGWTGNVLMKVYGEGAYTLVLEFTKQRGG